MPLNDLSTAPDTYAPYCLFQTSCEPQRNMLKSPYPSGFPKKHVGPAALPSYGWIH
jgi:hypothetical protein